MQRHANGHDLRASLLASRQEREVSNVVKVGSHVIYVDTRGREREALVTNIFGSGDESTCINVVYVNGDEDQTDDYGRKLARSSSTVHQSRQMAHGNFWKMPGA